MRLRLVADMPGPVCQWCRLGHVLDGVFCVGRVVRPLPLPVAVRNAAERVRAAARAVAALLLEEGDADERLTTSPP